MYSLIMTVGPGHSRRPSPRGPEPLVSLDSPSWMWMFRHLLPFLQPALVPQKGHTTTCPSRAAARRGGACGGPLLDDRHGGTGDGPGRRRRVDALVVLMLVLRPGKPTDLITNGFSQNGYELTVVVVVAVDGGGCCCCCACLNIIMSINHNPNSPIRACFFGVLADLKD